MDLIELNEAFAAQVLAVLREWELPDGLERVNVNGSGISLGHPIGATGGRILATLLRELRPPRRPLRPGDDVHRRRPGAGGDLRERARRAMSSGAGGRARPCARWSRRWRRSSAAPVGRASDEAAEWIAERLRAAGCAAAVEAEDFLDGYARLISALAAASALAGRGRAGRAAGPAGWPGWPPAPRPRRSPTTSPTARGCSAAPRPGRRPTWNVVATAATARRRGRSSCSPTTTPRPPARIFDDRRPGAGWASASPGVHRADRHLAAAVVAGARRAGAGRARRRHAAAGGCWPPGVAGSARRRGRASTDIARSPVVPGANDNLTAVAVLVALAERLRAEPVDGAARAAGLLRRRGGHPGRDLRLRRAPLPGAGPRADLVPQPRDGRLARS